MKRMRKIIGLLFLAFSNSCFAQTKSVSSLDVELINAMKTYKVPAVGYAIIDQNKIVQANTLSIDPKITVTVNSLFQAASISKSVSAFGALKLVSEKKLDLNEPLNLKLTTWKIPTNALNEKNPVVLKQVLSMTSGLSVSGFPGYSQGEVLPTRTQVLDGKPPSKTPPIRVFYKPGSRYFYSGGGFEVLEQWMEDTTAQNFSTWMKNEILNPLQMTHSLFQYPLEKETALKVVPGYYADGTEIKNGWYNYAIASAGGLWSTPIDLAKFAIGISNAYSGKDNSLVNQVVAKQMLTRQKNTDYGLGVVVDGQEKELNFRKGGHNTGYHNQLILFPNTGQGMVVMTNSENGEAIINYIIPLVAKINHWPNYFPFFDELIQLPE